MEEVSIDVSNATLNVRSPQPNGSRPLPLPPSIDPVIFQLQPERAKLTAENEKLKESLQLSEAQRSSLEGEIQARDKKVNELDLLRHKSQTEVKQLRTIIFKGGTPNIGPSDNEIRSEFCSIRNSILKIARDYYQASEVSLRHSTTTPGQRQRQWLGHWNQLITEHRNYRVQGAIFNTIFDQMFSKPVFGAHQVSEESLRKFEDEMGRCRESKWLRYEATIVRVTKCQTIVSRADLVEWRRRTVTLVKSLRNMSDIAERTAKKLQEMLEPALTPHLQQAPRPRTERLGHEVRTLCENSLKLALVLRESKAIFRVVKPELDTRVTEDDAEMMLVAVEEGSPSAKTKIKYIVFGGLEKTTINPGGSEETVQLEKAHVVGYCD